MSLKKFRSLLKEEIVGLLQLLSGDQQLEEMVRYPLSSPDRPLSVYLSESRWTTLPIIVCHSICGEYEPAIPLAAATGFLQTAGDVLDDVEDLDSDNSLAALHGRAEATNASTALLMLGQLALTRLHRTRVSSDTIVAIIGQVSQYGLTACIGQHRDIRHNTNPLISEEEYLRTISMKSAAQVECAARIGAMVATDDKQIIDTFTVFGHNLGMAAQIINDMQGVTKAALNRNDIAKKLVTLPLIYALKTAEGGKRELLESIYNGQVPITTAVVENVKEVLYSTGAIHYTRLP